MISLESLQDLFDYNYWARDQQLAVCMTLTQEDLERRLGGSFGSVHDTLKHLLGAEYVWLERFNGSSPRTIPWLDEMSNLEAIRLRWEEVERGMRACIRGLDTGRLATPLTYQNLKGETWTYPLWQALMHLANHGTYHRGQVTMGLRLLGAQPPAIDFLVYYDKVRRTRSVNSV
jgi:uncharacterized damage-inducible protein DinB